MIRLISRLSLGMLVIMLGAGALADWDPGQGHKMFQGPQMPDEEGFNVRVSHGLSLADDWQCSQTGTVSEVHFWGSWRGGTAGIINGFTLSVYSNVPSDHTVNYPAECPYATTTEPMQIINGFPPATTIDMDARIQDYYNLARQDGGNLGGEIVTFDATLDLNVSGTGDLAGFNRHLFVPVALEVHIGPKETGQPVQTFDMELVSMQGELFGDPDFCTFRVVGGSDFGLPSPGHTTLTDLGDGTFQIDSFFDVTYQIEFEGCPGSILEGFAGTTPGSSRFAQYDVTGGYGNYTDCVVPDDGTAGSFSRPGDLLWGPVSITSFVERPITPNPQLWESWYDPLGGEVLFDDHDNYYQYNITNIPNPFVQTEGEIYWLCITADVDDSGDPNLKLGWKSTNDHWMDDAVTGTATCTAPDNGTGTVDLPVIGCDFDPVPADATMHIINGLPPNTSLELAPILTGIYCPTTHYNCSMALPGGVCEMAGGSLGGSGTCFESTLDLTVRGTGSLAGFNRHLFVPVSMEVHHGPRNPGDPTQSFDSDVYRLQGELFGDPDFCTFRVVGGTDYGLPSPGHTTLTDLGGGTYSVDSFFDVMYQIEFEGCPGSQLEGYSGTTTGTIRLHQGGQIWSEMYEPIRPPDVLNNPFDVVMDPGGVVVAGGGGGAYGDGWYFYPLENWWNIWFYDHPLDYERAKDVVLDELIVNTMAPGPGFIEIAINWSTDVWSLQGNPPGDRRPPLPGEDENQYIGRQVIWAQEVFDFPTPIPPLQHLIAGYNPEWVSVDIRGFNFILNGIIVHTCYSTGDPQSLDLAFVVDGDPVGACCYPDGSCDMVSNSECFDGSGTWIGEWTTCEGDLNPPNGIDDLCEGGPFGACCFNDGSCVQHNETYCANLGGTYIGDGIPCLGDLNFNSIDDACEPTGACCLPGGDCVIANEIDCETSLNGSYLGDDAPCQGDLNGNGMDDGCEPVGACCHSDGSCTIENQTDCETTYHGTYVGDGSVCMGDGDANGTDDACETPKDMKWRQLPDLNETGMDVTAWDDRVLADDFECTVTGPVTEVRIWGSWLHDEYPGGDPGNMNVTLALHSDIPSTSTVSYPAACPYATTAEPMLIINGLPPATTIEMPAMLMDYYNIIRVPGGNLGGERITFDATLDLDVSGTGSLAGFNRHLFVPVSLEVHTGPKAIGNDPQVFPLELVRLQGELFGDPDFCTFRVIAGSDAGLPSPGQSTLTKLPDGTFQVDSFFDITYQIDFEGCPGSILDGYSGSTTATSRFTQFDISGGPGNWSECIVPDEGEYSRPDGILWTRTYGPGEFLVEQYAADLDEGFYDLLGGVYEFPGDHVCWKYTFPIDPEDFEQQGTEASPVVYWLSVNASNPTMPGHFGWKTSTSHWNDDAAFWVTGNWYELRYPPGHPLSPISVDMAFEIYGTTSCCVGRVGDANGVGGDEPTIGDVSVMIDAKFITGTCVVDEGLPTENRIIECLSEADVNQSGGFSPTCDDITIGDISYLIDYLFITGPPLGLPNCL